MEREGRVCPASDELSQPHHGVHGRPALLPRLPIRIAELGNMHRWEKSGQLTGMSRVRIMTLNDAHIFCADTVRWSRRSKASCT